MKTVKDASELQSNALSISYPLPAIVGCGLWEDLSNGYVTKKPKKKRTSVQIIADSGPDDAGRVRLSINPQHAGPAPWFKAKFPFRLSVQWVHRSTQI